LKILFIGYLQSGKNDASRWLEMFNEAYSAKTGIAIFPGSLNLALDNTFDWFSPIYQNQIIQFKKSEYGGERDILLLPCTLLSLGKRKAFFRTTTTAARDRPDPHVVEVITDVKLRDAYGLSDGSRVEFELDL
jgi:riboflavin kinase